ncbi:MAG: radical SAM protein [Deltaproteobacteria bacterium]|nr:radical SAM protein [Deltaproteobacteria bacterium]
MADPHARARSLPLAPVAEPALRQRPLDDVARPVDRAWRPIYVVWEFTLRCDLACRHCGSRAGRARPDELSTEEALDVVRQLAALGVPEVTLIGGEAYLREDWTTVGRAIRDAGMELTMVTGGRGMTAERARQAAQAGFQSASVSFEGLEATHDRLRGIPGTFKSAMGALKNLQDAGVPVSANTQISRAGALEIEALTEVLMDAGIHSWQPSLTVPLGRAADLPELILEPFQVLDVLPMLARVARRMRERKVRFWPGNDVGYFGPYETLFRGMLPRGHMASCGAGRAILGIEANGDLKGCLSLPSKAYVGGNVRDHSVQDIWERTRALRFTRDRTTEDLWGYCRECYYSDVCRSGCSMTCHVLAGRTGNNPFCHHRALEYLREGLRERLQRVAPASNEPFDHARFESYLEPWPEDELAQARAVAASGEGWLDYTTRAQEGYTDTHEAPDGAAGS